jgi:hypothetical protein
MGNNAYNEGMKAALDVDEAMDHIDNIFSARILAIYGLGQALNVAAAEFDQIMSLAPKPPAGTGSIFLDAFISVLEHIPVAGEAYEGAKIVAEVAHHTAKMIKGAQTAASKFEEAAKHFREDGKQLDSLEPDEDAMKIIRSLSSKAPVFQNVVWARYKVEYDRRDARQRFRRDLRTALDQRTFTGKPIDLAKKEFGPAPADLSKDDVYKQFEAVEKQMLRELVRSYVRKYVAVERVTYHPATGPAYDSWLITEGLNQPQWDAIYVRFGKKADKRMEAARSVHAVATIANTFAQAMGIRLNPLQMQEPILGGAEDLWRFWGAKYYFTEQYWYGKSGPFYQRVGLANPVR